MTSKQPPKDDPPGFGIEFWYSQPELVATMTFLCAGYTILESVQSLVEALNARGHRMPDTAIGACIKGLGNPDNTFSYKGRDPSST